MKYSNLVISVTTKQSMMIVIILLLVMSKYKPEISSFFLARHKSIHKSLRYLWADGISTEEDIECVIFHIHYTCEGNLQLISSRCDNS